MIRILIISLLLFASNIQAQSSIKGNVTDSHTKQPIPDVSILIKDTKTGTNTDFDGKYSLKNITQGKITLVFSYVGYKDKIIEVIAGKTLQIVNITLDEDVFEIDEIILATPFNKLQSENVVKVAHKSLASMQKKGIQNLMDGVSQISGVTQMNTGSGISKPVIRGLTGNRVLVYNQGVRLENFQSGDLHGIGINEAGISSVEVIKGPASLLYGSDAVGGVLYLVPEKYALKGKTKIDFRSKYTSNTLGTNSTLGVKTSLDKFQFLARGAINQNADYAVSDGYRVTNSRYKDRDFKAGLGYKTNFLTTDIRYSANLAKNGIPHNIGIQETSYEINGKHQDLENHVLSVKNDFNFKNTKLKTTIGHTWHNRKLILQNTTKIGMQLNTLNYDVKWYLPKWNKLESIVGLQGMTQSNKNFGSSQLLPDANTNSIGIFTTLHYKYKSSILQAGIRYDTRHIVSQDVGIVGNTSYRKGIDKNLNSFTSSIGLKTTLFDKTTLRFNLASGFRAPNLSELTSKGIHSGRIEIGNATLKNEQNLQADFALEYTHTHIEFFANAFVNKIDNYIYLTPTGVIEGDYSVFKYQQDNAQLYGGEVGLHLHPHPWDWLHINSSFETVTGKLDKNSYLPLIPANQWKNQLRITYKTKYKYLKKYYLNIGVNYTAPATKISNFESDQDAYTLFNSSIGSNFKFAKFTLRANLSARNLFDKKYISHLSVLRENKIPNMGRNIIVSLSVAL